MDLAKKIFGKDTFPNIKNYVTGEYKGRPNGQDMQQGVTTKFILLEQTNKKAVVALTISDSLNKGVDAYLHFAKGTVWKMCAFRGFAMTGVAEQIKNSLEKFTLQQVDDIITKSKEIKEFDFSFFTSREEYYFRLGNAKLVL